MKDGRATAVDGRRKRADAERSIAAILDAATDCFGANPSASMTEIARAAGVGRVTLYAHFPSREELLDAAVQRSVASASEVVDAIPLGDMPANEALDAMVRSSWQVVNRNRGLFSVVSREMPAETLRRHHDPLHDRLAMLIERGQIDGVFRRDLPVSWLIATAYNLMHGAAEEVQAGRLGAGEAGDVLVATIGSALRP
jgi:AcrR family transcriptional regulator